jgi:hypothetical protein
MTKRKATKGEVHAEAISPAGPAEREGGPEAAAQSSVELPPRIALRPDPDQWSAVELLSLAEAASLFWPMGPLTTTSLRTAVRDHQLDVAVIAGKILTNKESILKMSRCSARKLEDPQEALAPILEAKAGAPRSVAEYRRMVAEGRL